MRDQDVCVGMKIFPPSNKTAGVVGLNQDPNYKEMVEQGYAYVNGYIESIGYKSYEVSNKRLPHTGNLYYAKDFIPYAEDRESIPYGRDNSLLEVGMKVVPVKKSVFSNLESSRAWNAAKELNQPYLVIARVGIKIYSRSAACGIECGTDLFLPTDLIAYEEGEKKEMKELVAGDSVRIRDLSYFSVLVNGSISTANVLETSGTPFKIVETGLNVPVMYLGSISSVRLDTMLQDTNGKRYLTNHCFLTKVDEEDHAEFKVFGVTYSVKATRTEKDSIAGIKIDVNVA